MRLRAVALLVALLVPILLGSSCGGDDASGPELIYGSPEGIVKRSVQGDGREILVEPPPRSTIANPALSPDGTRMAYTVGNPLRPENGVLGGGADLWIANSDGSEPVLVYEHRLHTEVVTSVAWLDDARLLAVIRFLEGVPPASRSIFTLTRIDATTGERADLIPGVLSFGLSPDGMRVAYVKLESIEEQPLYVSNIDGSNPQRLLDSESGFGGFVSPVFSPDGSTLYFGGHEESEGEHDHSRGDLLSVSSSGGTPVKVASVEASEPGLAIDREGTHIYALGGGLFDVVLDTGSVSELEDVVSAGGLAVVE